MGETTVGFALSPQQRRLWRLSGPGAPQSPAWIALALDGGRSRDELETALARLARRHEILRTRLERVEGLEEPLQSVEPEATVTVLAPPAGEDLVAAAVSAFEGRGEGARGLAVALAPGDGGSVRRLVLAVAAHAADHLALHALAGELGELLEEPGSTGGSLDAQIQYGDVAALFAELLEAEDTRAGRQEWAGRLPAGLPTWAGDGTAGFRPRAVVRRLDPVAAEGLGSAAAQAAGAGVAAGPGLGIVAALAAAWWRVAEGSDLVPPALGVAASGRSDPALERLPGLFARCLPLGAGSPGLADGVSASLGEKARRLAAALAEAVELQDYLALEPPLYLPHLVQVLDAPESGAGLVVESAWAAEERFDLRLTLAGPAGARRLRLELAREDEALAHRLLDRLETLLAAVASRPATPAGKLPLVGAAERALLVGRIAPGPPALGGPSDTLHGLVLERLRARPEEVAIEGADGARLGGGELDRATACLAARLRAAGAGPERPVAVVGGRSAETMVALLAVLRAGSFYQPIDPELPPERLRFLLADGGARVAVVAGSPERLSPETRRALDGFELVRCALDELPGTTGPADAPAGPVPSFEAAAYLLHTSGSTGRPKGVVVSHRAVVNRLLWSQAAYPLSEADRVLQAAALGFDFSVWEIFAPLAFGAALVLPSEEAQQDPAVLLGEVAGRGVTVVHFVPSLLAAGLDGEGPLAEARALRLLLVGGEALSPRLARLLRERLPGAELINQYGPTETTIDVTFERLEEHVAGDPIPIGRPIAGVRTHVVDRTMELVPLGAAGELAVAGAGLARGYLGRPAATAERFVPDPFAELPGDRLYRTGDQVRLDGEGRLLFLGRTDRQVQVRGVRVEPAEVEAALAAHPGVRRAVVGPLGLAGGAEGSALSLVAWWVPESAPEGPGTGEPSDRELARFLAEALPASLVPGAFVRMEALPLTSAGKLDLAALPAPVAAGSVGSAGRRRAPADPLEAELTDLWSAVLEVESGPDDDFFAAGGHSLLALRLVGRIAERLGLEVGVREVFDAPTPARLSERLRGRAPSASRLPPLAPGARPVVVPASFQQRRLWFLDRLAPGTAFYNIPLAVELEGELDRPAFARAVAGALARHEALRTRLAAREGEPVQEVAPPSAPPLPVIDLAGLPEPVAGAAGAAVGRALARRPFDLARGPVVRLALVAVGARLHRLHLAVHHAMADGRSIEILVEETAALYRRAGEPERQEPAWEPVVQYSEYALWQRGPLAETVLPAQLDWWRERLADFPHVLELPSDRPRPAVQSFGGRLVRRALSAGAGAAWERLAVPGTTRFTILAAGFAALVARLTGREALVLGTPIENRPLPELGRAVGCFTNEVMLPLRPTAETPFPQLVGEVREALAGALAHGDLPFERLVESLAPERDLARHPLVQVSIASSRPPAAPRLPGLRARPVLTDPGTARMDLALVVREEPGGPVLLEAEHSDALFDPTTVARWLRALDTLLRAVAERPEVPVDELPLLGPAERAQVLVEWNDTERARPLATFPERFRRWVRARPGAPAVEVPGSSPVSYGELGSMVDRIAGRLRRAGIGRERRVALCLERSAELLAALLAVLEAGGAFVPLEPALPGERLDRMLTDSAADLLVTTPELAGRFGAVPVPVLSLSEALSADPAQGARPEPPHPEDLAYVLYTSGSTGAPKGVMVEHGALANLVDWLGAFYRVRPGTRISQLASFAFDGAVGETATALAHGGTLVVVGLGGAEPARLVDELAGTDVAVAVPSLLDTLDPDRRGATGARAPATLVAVGEEVTGGLAASWGPGRRFVNGYGPAECTVYSHVWTSPAGAGTPAWRVPIGRPLPNLAALVVDRRLRPVPPGVAGELCLGGSGLARGYLGRPATTAERFVPAPSAGPSPAVPRDLGRLDDPEARRAIEELRARRGAAPTARRTGDRLTPRQVLEFVEGLDEDLVAEVERLLAATGARGPTWRGFCRYMVEAAGDSYAAAGLAGGVLDRLLGGLGPVAPAGAAAVDLCFGNGEVLAELAGRGFRVRGLDLDPCFVQRGRERGLDVAMGRADGPADELLGRLGIAPGSQDLALTTLSLDRVERPRRLLANLLLCLAPGGRFVVTTLLPVVPVDDGDALRPITYTPAEERIAPGTHAAEDLAALARVLAELGGEALEVARFPYAVASRDGFQEYEAWGLAGRRAARRSWGARLYRTGDLVRQLADGRLEFLGRIDRQVQVRGQRVEPGEVGSVLAGHPAVVAAAVEPVCGPDGTTVLAAWVVTAPGWAEGRQQPEAELRRHLAERLPAAWVPSGLALVDSLPRMASGKIDRAALAALGAGGGVDSAGSVAPRGAVEELVARTMAEVLGLPRVGATDGFFDLGGHSLLATRLLGRLGELFGVELPVSELFARPTVEGVAAALEGALGEAGVAGEVARAWLDVTSLSDEEVEARLAAEAPDAPGEGGDAPP